MTTEPLPPPAGSEENACMHPWAEIELTIVPEKEGRILACCRLCVCLLPLPGGGIEESSVADLIAGARSVLTEQSREEKRA